MRLLYCTRKYLFLVLFSFPFQLFAYDGFFTGTRFLALGGCGSSITDIWSMSYNQAGIAFLESTTFSAFHEQKYLLKELSNSAIAFVVPTKPINIGVSAYYFGYSKYHEVKAGVTFARMFGSKFAAGIRFNYYNTFLASSEQNISKYNLDLGLISLLSENLTLGFHVLNLMPDKQEEFIDPKISTSASLGMAYNFDKKLTILAEAQSGISQHPCFMSGIEYFIIKQLALRIGITAQSGNPGYSFGFGYQYKLLNIGMAFVKNQVLDMSPSIEIGYSF
jgi:hypothetical protein